MTLPTVFHSNGRRAFLAPGSVTLCAWVNNRWEVGVRFGDDWEGACNLARTLLSSGVGEPRYLVVRPSGHEDIPDEVLTVDAQHERFHAEFDRWLAEHDAQVKAKALGDVATKRWVCEVQSSGYHNGATCRPDDPHEGWRCEYRYEFSVPATRIEREGTGEED